MSTFFHISRPSKKKSICLHPWEKTIKSAYSNKIKTAHNSINNPVYTANKEKPPSTLNRTKICVIGNRVTKEFVYCVSVAKELARYRPKYFYTPDIRGLTGVEWPTVWNKLKIEYDGMAYCLQSQVAVIINGQFLGGEPELRQLVESNYLYDLPIDYYKESVNSFTKYINRSGRPCAYLHFSINTKYIGTMIFMLYADIVPRTCDNFLRLCQVRRGGYSGTPVHRIVKDCWIQCGGYGLKDSNLNCENFIVPHDRRGLLCMANDGRNVDCSTQFFVLLQPASWMANKYVAFGQLIDGEKTLKQIEDVPTWYESPTSDISVIDAGILNLDRQHIPINKGAFSFIQGHIENLNMIGALFYEAVLEKVFLEIEMRQLELLRREQDINEEEQSLNDNETERFYRHKKDIQKQNETIEDIRTRNDENNEFDVENYSYEPEEDSYKPTSPTRSPTPQIAEAPYYIPLTDVPYPGEIDSTYDLKKFLQGNYCLEMDLEKNSTKRPIYREHRGSCDSMIFGVTSEVKSDISLLSEEEREIQQYLKYNIDRISFAGEIIQGIAKGVGKFNLLEHMRRSSDLITDDQLRKLKLQSGESRRNEMSEPSHDKKVSLAPPIDEPQHLPQKIKRGQIDFIRQKDLDRISNMELDSLPNQRDPSNENTIMSRKVHINPTLLKSSARTASSASLPQTDYGQEGDAFDFGNEHRPSVFTRLYEDIDKRDERGPTLKDYKPVSLTHKSGFHLLTNTNSRMKIKFEDSSRDRFIRHSITQERHDSFENMMNIQHGKKCARKISSDYVKTIDQVEHKADNMSIRTLEYAKLRPAITVAEYQKRNMLRSTRPAVDAEDINSEK